MLYGVQGPGASVKAIEGTAAKGMILPFEPMALTFHKISYYVPFPKVPRTPCQKTNVLTQHGMQLADLRLVELFCSIVAILSGLCWCSL